MCQLERAIWQEMGGTSHGDRTSHLPVFLPVCATEVYSAGVKPWVPCVGKEMSQKFQRGANVRLLAALAA